MLTWYTDELIGEWGDGVCSSQDEDVVPALIKLARKLDEFGYLSSGQQDDLAYYDAAWDDHTPDLPYQEALSDMIEAALPAGLALDISGQWADRCVYVDYDPQYRIALVVSDEDEDTLEQQVEDLCGEVETDSAGRITVPYEYLQEVEDRLDLCGIAYTEVW